MASDTLHDLSGSVAHQIYMVEEYNPS